tara:strand:- start:723 stop:1001 length:279 start_codon:yes stop_codon:yes gene_type:complete
MFHALQVLRQAWLIATRKPLIKERTSFLSQMVTIAEFVIVSQFTDEHMNKDAIRLAKVDLMLPMLLLMRLCQKSLKLPSVEVCSAFRVLALN